MQVPLRVQRVHGLHINVGIVGVLIFIARGTGLAGSGYLAEQGGFVHTVVLHAAIGQAVSQFIRLIAPNPFAGVLEFKAVKIPGNAAGTANGRGAAGRQVLQIVPVSCIADEVNSVSCFKLVFQVKADLGIAAVDARIRLRGSGAGECLRRRAKRRGFAAGSSAFEAAGIGCALIKPIYQGG